MRTNIGALGVAAALAAGACLPRARPARAAEPVLRLTEAVEYSSGKYGAVEATDVAVATSAAKLTYDGWFLRAAIPYLSIRGPADVVLDDQGAITEAGDPTRKRTESGFGDTTLSVGRSFSRLGGSSAYLDVTARVRLPTGSRVRGLGVGAVDYGLAGELGVDGERGGAYVSAGLRFLGAVPGLDRRDGWQAGAGGWLNLGKKTTLGAGYDFRRASVRGLADPSELYGYLSRAIGGGWRGELNGGAGLSDGSPDYSVGLSLLWRPQTRHRR